MGLSLLARCQRTARNVALNRRAAIKLAGVTAALTALSTSAGKKVETLKLGKLPATPPKVMLRDYIVPDRLPPLPDGDFGHYPLVSNWGMLGNGPDPGNPPSSPGGVGCCAEAGPFHSLQLWNKMSGVDINCNAACTIAAYSQITGYDPKNPLTDQGSDVQAVAEYWRTQGLVDASGVNHKIDAYVALEPGNPEQLFHAMYLFNAVGIGVRFPMEWMNAFNAGVPWDVVAKPNIAGGHLITGVGRRGGMIPVVSWGRVHLLTVAGYQQFNDESFAYMDEDKLVNGRDIDGFDLAQLKADLADIANGG